MHKSNFSKYAVLGSAEYTSGEIYLRTISLADMEEIRIWRNSQIGILRQSNILSADDQTSYFFNVISPDFSTTIPKQILFVIFLHEKRVGYGGLVHIDWDKQIAEVSFLLDPLLS